MKERTRLALRFEAVLIGICLVLVLLWLLTSCTTTKYIPVTSEHTEHHWHTDTVIQRDSVVKESLTTVMQLDSAEMARYGIKLKSSERAWLVKTAEMERIINELMAKSEARDTVRDSIPVPYEVMKEVPAELSTGQKGLMLVGIASLMALLIFIVYKLKRFLP
jgi:hypothetical protein